jgi:hypothetical protein
MYLLTNSHGNRWYLTYNGTVLDACVAANQPLAAMLVAHMLPACGEWEKVSASQYRYRTDRLDRLIDREMRRA